MAVVISDGLAGALLAGDDFKALFETGESFLYIFSGPMPTSADAALSVPGTHQMLAKLAADSPAVADGVVGLEFAASPVNRALAKSGAQTWSAVIANSGTATFYRLCGPGDNGQSAGGSSTYRLQGTVATAGGDINLGNTGLTANGTNTVGLSAYEVRVL